MDSAFNDVERFFQFVKEFESRDHGPYPGTPEERAIAEEINSILADSAGFQERCRIFNLTNKAQS